jgi:hypothetical protein
MRLNGVCVNSAARFGYFEPPVPFLVLPVAGLRHEARDHAVERHVVIILVARELLDAFGMLGREVGPQLENDAAHIGIDDDGVLGIGTGRQLYGLRERRRSANQAGKNGEQSDHGTPPPAPALPANCFQARSGRRRHNGETLPPIAAITAPVWR